MSHREPTPLVIAVRVFPDLKDENRDFDKPPREWHRPDAMLVFDTETRTDRTQRLTFGSYRFIVGGLLVSENLFYGDGLPTKDHRILERHVATHVKGFSTQARATKVLRFSNTQRLPFSPFYRPHGRDTPPFEDDYVG